MLLIAGPTASGKSDLAVRVAERLDARSVVVNADSAQVYADLSVLSARPTPEEMRGIDHRLFGEWDGATPCSAADWARAASAEIDSVHASGGVPILVGGTGLYLRTLIEGIAPVPEIDPAIRREVRAMPVGEAYAALQAEDPDRAAALNAADTTRVARALEVVRSTGHSLRYWQDRLEGGIGQRIDLRAAVLLPDREALFERCDHRFAQMLERGAIDEVRALLARGLDRALPVMRAIGVPEIAAHLAGEASLSETCERGALATRQYAKRQYTWFRNQPPANWHRLRYDDFNIRHLLDRLFQDLRLT